MRRSPEEAIQALRTQVKDWSTGKTKADLRILAYAPEWEADMLRRIRLLANELVSDGMPIELADAGQALMTAVEFAPQSPGAPGRGRPSRPKRRLRGPERARANGAGAPVAERVSRWDGCPSRREYRGTRDARLLLADHKRLLRHRQRLGRGYGIGISGRCRRALFEPPSPPRRHRLPRTAHLNGSWG